MTSGTNNVFIFDVCDVGGINEWVLDDFIFFQKKLTCGDHDRYPEGTGQRYATAVFELSSDSPSLARSMTVASITTVPQPHWLAGTADYGSLIEDNETFHN